jgi:hypothetical protein
MRQTPARQLLDGWEAFRGDPMPVRASALAALGRDVPLAEAMRWSIARRDLALFDLRAQVFGESLDAVTQCPKCSEQLEMQFTLSQIRPHGTAEPDVEFRALLVDGASVRCRLPNSEDVLAVMSDGDVAGARHHLIERCIEADSQELRERAAALLAAESADVHLHLTCPSCDHAWRAAFDIAMFVWRELDEWAQRTLREIHVLASAYGWTEDGILQLTARRRHTYVEMIR